MALGRPMLWALLCLCARRLITVPNSNLGSVLPPNLIERSEFFAGVGTLTDR